MIEYTCVSHRTEAELTSIVTRYIKEGWKLQGGVSVAIDTRYKGNLFAQALIKEEKQED